MKWLAVAEAIVRAMTHPRAWWWGPQRQNEARVRRALDLKWELTLKNPERR